MLSQSKTCFRYDEEELPVLWSFCSSLSFVLVPARAIFFCIFLYGQHRCTRVLKELTRFIAPCGIAPFCADMSSNPTRRSKGQYSMVQVDIDTIDKTTTHGGWASRSADSSEDIFYHSLHHQQQLMLPPLCCDTLHPRMRWRMTTVVPLSPLPNLSGAGRVESPHMLQEEPCCYPLRHNNRTACLSCLQQKGTHARSVAPSPLRALANQTDKTATETTLLQYDQHTPTPNRQVFSRATLLFATHP